MYLIGLCAKKQTWETTTQKIGMCDECDSLFFRHKITLDKLICY